LSEAFEIDIALRRNSNDRVGTGALTKPALSGVEWVRGAGSSGRISLHPQRWVPILVAFCATGWGFWISIHEEMPRRFRIRIRIRLQPYRKIRNWCLPALASYAADSLILT